MLVAVIMTMAITTVRYSGKEIIYVLSFNLWHANGGVDEVAIINATVLLLVSVLTRLGRPVMTIFPRKILLSQL
jgi:hypothetical protein